MKTNWQALSDLLQGENLLVKTFYWLLYIVALALSSDVFPFVLGVGAGFLIGLCL